MFKNRCFSLLLALCCLAGLCGTAGALEIDSDSTYCFRAEDFSQDALSGICVTQLPDSSSGTVFLGSRVLRPGDILTAGQLSQLTFSPLPTAVDKDAVVTFLPIYPDRVAESATMTIAIRGKQDKAPAAEDFSEETYKNLPLEGTLKAHDPEGKELTFAITRQPRRGQVTLTEDGSFTYTPKKNKVGTDSFTYTATDPAGNVSREATVTVQILKPSDSKLYADTVGKDCRFAAEWMRHTGLFVGEQVGGQTCFHPDKAVTRGEFLTMAVQLLNIPHAEQTDAGELSADAPDWLKPYLTAALRSGLIAGTPLDEAGGFDLNAPITGAEAAVMLQNILDLDVQTAAPAESGKTDLPTWADASLQAMAQNGISLQNEGALNRAEVAMLLYDTSRAAQSAPGMTVVNKQS